MREEFEITITAAEPPPGGSNVTVRYARGVRTGGFSLSSVATAVTSLYAAMLTAQPVQPELEAAGRALFAALFSGRVGEAWRECVTLAHERGQGVRLRLYCELPSLTAVPWEYLYDQAQGRWLALDSNLSLVRALQVATKEALVVSGPLRVLVMLATPRDLPELAAAREWANLEEAVTNAAIELTRVEPTYAALQDALRQSPHIFHFVGHGKFDNTSQQGVLALQHGDGAADFIAADQLAVLLSGCQTLRLALLNACQGAVTGTSSAFAGLAQRLIQQGTAAVIALQAPIYDDHALRFSQEFYRALADGLSVEQAVGEGRKRINQVAGSWGIPTVYFQGVEPFRLVAAHGQAPGAQPGVAIQTGGDLKTGGGAVIAGSVTAGRDVIGRGQIIQGATPEQFAAMLTRLVELMVEIRQASNLLLGARSLLENARRQLRRLAEYKEAHDLLQQLESSYLVIYSLIYDEGELLAPAQVRWRSLERSGDDLQSSIQRVCNVTAAASFAADVADSRGELGRAASDLPRAFGGRDLDLLDALLADVQRVIGTQTPRMNDRLIAALDGLQLGELARRLTTMYGDLMQPHGELGHGRAEQLAALASDVAGLGQLAERLTQLRNAHDRWQQADNELRAQQAVLPTAGRRFPVHWQRSLGQRLRQLCAAVADEQERALATQIAAVDALLAQPEPLALADAIDGCRRAVARQLNQIDHDLRTLCTRLQEAGGPLDTLLERLV
jgi:hypothetical protein